MTGRFSYQELIKYQTDRVLLILLLVSYCFFYQGGGWNQNARLAQIRSLVEHGELNIDRWVDVTGDWSRYEGHTYPNKPPGMTFLAAPFYFVLNLLDKYTGILSDNKVQAAQWSLYILTILLSALPAALFGLVYYRFLFKISHLSLKEAIILTIIFQLCTPVFPYATLFSPHILTMIFSFLSFYFLCTYIYQTNNKKYIIISGVLSGLAIMVDYTHAVVSLFYLIYLFSKKKSVKNAAIYILSWLIPVILLCVYQAVCFGKFYYTSYHFQNPLFIAAAEKTFQVPSLMVLLHLTVLPYKGLFSIAPIFLAAVPGWIYFFHEYENRDEWLLFTAIILYYLLLNMSFIRWDGGRSTGPRYLIPVFPFFYTSIVFVYRRHKKIIYTLALISFFFMAASTIVGPEIPEQYRRPITRYVLPNFVTGHYALNYQTPLEKYPRYGDKYVDVKRRKFSGAWNMGQRFGMPTIFSGVILFFFWFSMIFYIRYRILYHML